MTERNHFDGKLYVDHFGARKTSLPNADVDWLADIRARALADYEQVGIPGPKVEEWKYTNLAPLKSSVFETVCESADVSEKHSDQISFFDMPGAKVVFVDGYFDDAHSQLGTDGGILIKSLNEYVKGNANSAKAMFERSAASGSLQNLNLALMTGGYVIEVAADVKLSEPIQIIHLATEQANGKALRTKNFINLNVGSSAQIIESFIGADGCQIWRQLNSSVVLAENSSLEIYQVQLEGDETIHMADTDIALAEASDFKHYSLNVGAKISRTEIKPTLSGSQANVDLRGAFLGRDGNSHDIFSHMKHMVPECTSDQIYRGVLDKDGKSAFQGKVYVAKDAQLTNADQSNKNLILDRSAEANSKPELLIYADDVKCSHGATVGELDQEALFYLQSRGLDQKAAKALLVEAFVAEVFDDVSIEPVREKYLEMARAWLDKGE